MVALSAGGRQFDDALAAELAAEPELTLLCGRYEGFDERVHEHLASDVVSIGPYVLSGGELAAMVVCDAVIRKLPGALGHEESAVEESFSQALEGAPEYPHYTRPAEWRGHGGARDPAVRRPCPHPRVAARAEPRAPRRAPVRARAPATIRAPREPAGLAPFSVMSTVIDNLERAQLRKVPSFQAGDRVRVHFQVVEGTRRRTQVFEGIVLKRQGSGARETFTVRKQSFGVGVERTFPVHSPKIEQIEVASRGDVRRAKLYYLRDRVGRGARVRERRYTAEEVEEGVMPPPEAEPTPEEIAEVEAAAEEVAAGEEPAGEDELPPRKRRRATMLRPRRHRRRQDAPAEERCRAEDARRRGPHRRAAPRRERGERRGG